MVSELLWLKGIEGEYKNILGLVTSIDLSRNKLSGEIPTEITYPDGLLLLCSFINYGDIRIFTSLMTCGTNCNHIGYCWLVINDKFRQK